MSTKFDKILGALRENDLGGITNPFQFKGDIAINTDFPLLAAVQNGWFYTISAAVTDNAGGGRTNTGQSFVAGDEIAWNGTGWTLVGNDFVPQSTKTLWVDNNRTDTYTEDGTNLRPYKTIQSAVNAAEILITTNSITGYVIKIQGGDYSAENITITKSLSLEGMDRLSTRINNLTLRPSTALLGVWDCRIMNLGIMGNVIISGETAPASGIFYPSMAGNEILFESCSVYGTFTADTCNYLAGQGLFVVGAMTMSNVAGFWPNFSEFAGGVTVNYDTALTEPSDNGAYGFNAYDGATTNLTLVTTALSASPARLAGRGLTISGILNANALSEYSMEGGYIGTLTADPASIEVSYSAKQPYDNTTSGLTAKNVQNAIDELASSGGGSYFTEENIVFVDSLAVPTAGVVYADIAAAIVYVNTQTPSATNLWKIVCNSETDATSFILPQFVTLECQKTRLTGTIDASGLYNILGGLELIYQMPSIKNAVIDNINLTDTVLYSGNLTLYDCVISTAGIGIQTNAAYAGIVFTQNCFVNKTNILSCFMFLNDNTTMSGSSHVFNSSAFVFFSSGTSLSTFDFAINTGSVEFNGFTFSPVSTVTGAGGNLILNGCPGAAPNVAGYSGTYTVNPDIGDYSPMTFVIEVDPNKIEVVGKIYQTYASALAYALTLGATSTNTVKIQLPSGDFTEAIDLNSNIVVEGHPAGTYVSGDLTSSVAFAGFLTNKSVISNCEIASLANVTAANYMFLDHCILRGTKPATTILGYFILTGFSQISNIAATTTVDVTSATLFIMWGGSMQGYALNDIILPTSGTRSFNGVIFNGGVSLAGGNFENCSIVGTNFTLDGDYYINGGSWGNNGVTTQISAGNSLRLNNVYIPASTSITIDSGANLYTRGITGTEPGITNSGNWYNEGILWSPVTNKYILDYADFSAAATSNQILLYTFPPKTILKDIYLQHTTQFSDAPAGVMTSYTISCGIVGNSTKFSVPFDVFQATATNVLQNTFCNAIEDSGAWGLYIEAVSDVNLDTATQGQLELIIETVTMPA